MMPPLKGVGCPFPILGPDKQVSACDRWIHATGVVRPNHGLDPGFIQDAFCHPRICG
nr:hypothetical protein [Luteitalea pratensis]